MIALGNFDGLHRGHQAVIAQARTFARHHKLPLAIGLFRPHPYRFFKPDAPPFRLMSAAYRTHVMPELGVDRLYEIPFNTELRDMDDAQFVTDVLYKGLGVRHVVIGEDFSFGKNRCGNVASLERLCAAYDIGVHTCAPLKLHRFYGKYGSTEIRKAIQAGDVFHAAHMLSRPWCVDGKVQRGDQRGRTIDFPTANLDFADLIHPKFGVYAVEVDLPDTRRAYGVANAGMRPTVGGKALRLEVHIFNFSDDIYDAYVRVHLRSFIRPEQEFASLDVLKNQIGKDVRSVKTLFAL